VTNRQPLDGRVGCSAHGPVDGQPSNSVTAGAIEDTRLMCMTAKSFYELLIDHSEIRSMGEAATPFWHRHGGPRGLECGARVRAAPVCRVPEVIRLLTWALVVSASRLPVDNSSQRWLLSTVFSILSIQKRRQSKGEGFEGKGARTVRFDARSVPAYVTCGLRSKLVGRSCAGKQWPLKCTKRRELIVK